MEGGTLAAKYLQLVRSTPLLVGAVVGHKGKEHVVQNIAVIKEPVLDAQEYRRIIDILDK